jgi:hypothetical protein
MDPQYHDSSPNRQSHEGFFPEASQTSVRLPEALGRALDAIADADREWFKQRVRRWRVRRTQAAERHSNAAVLSFDPRHGGCAGCGACQSWVMVLASPSGNIRLRCFFGGSRTRRPEDLLPGAADALAAQDDAAFVQALAPYLRAAGGNR